MVMTEPVANTPMPPGADAIQHVQTAPDQPPLFYVPHAWRLAGIVAVVMLLLALVGVGLTTANAEAARTYWITLVPVYGVLSIAAALARARNQKGYHPAVVRQLFHWAAIGTALALDFQIRRAGQETGTAAGLNALLLLALGCFLAGVHLEWPFALVGALLTLALICVDQAQQYLWLIFVAGGLAIVAILVLPRLLGGSRARRHGSHPSAPAVS
jgi:hypothetical protein